MCAVIYEEDRRRSYATWMAVIGNCKSVPLASHKCVITVGMFFQLVRATYMAFQTGVNGVLLLSSICDTCYYKMEPREVTLMAMASEWELKC